MRPVHRRQRGLRDPKPRHRPCFPAYGNAQIASMTDRQDRNILPVSDQGPEIGWAKPLTAGAYQMPAEPFHHARPTAFRFHDKGLLPESVATRKSRSSGDGLCRFAQPLPRRVRNLQRLWPLGPGHRHGGISCRSSMECLAAKVRAGHPAHAAARTRRSELPSELHPAAAARVGRLSQAEGEKPGSSPACA